MRYAFLNSYYQTGLKNLMDRAIIEHTKAFESDIPFGNLKTDYTKIDEIPFDFERRRMSVVVSDPNGSIQLITKGAIEEMLRISSYVEYNGEVTALTKEMRSYVLDQVGALNADGYAGSWNREKGLFACPQVHIPSLMKPTWY